MGHFLDKDALRPCSGSTGGARLGATFVAKNAIGQLNHTGFEVFLPPISVSTPMQPTPTHPLNTTSIVKEAQTEHPVHALIRQRWSARAFDAKPLATEVLLTLFEAAAWAPSAMNEQPWRYRYALRGTPAFDLLWSLLLPGNQPWAKDAAALVVCSGTKLLAKNHTPNVSWMHDVGLANANLLTQAVSMGIYGHLMGGFDHAKANAALSIDVEGEEVVCLLALGYLGGPEHLIEPFRTRELTARARRPLGETVTAL
jgi:nitroreductase